MNQKEDGSNFPPFFNLLEIKIDIGILPEFFLRRNQNSFLKIIVSRILIRGNPEGIPEEFYSEFFSPKTLVAFKQFIYPYAVDAS